MKISSWHVLETEDRQGKYHYYNRNWIGILAEELDDFTFYRAVSLLKKMYEDVFPSPDSNAIICRGVI